MRAPCSRTRVGLRGWCVGFQSASDGARSQDEVDVRRAQTLDHGPGAGASSATGGGALDLPQRAPLPALLVLAVVAASVLLPGLVRADDLAVLGSAIAAERCGKCHAVGAADASPHKIAPPLRELHQDFPIPMIEEALRTGRVGGHDEMPMFDLGPDGVRALAAYIDSLNPGGPQYIKARP